MIDDDTDPRVPTDDEVRRLATHPIAGPILAAFAARGDALTRDEFGDAWQRLTALDLDDELREPALMTLIFEFGERFGFMAE